MKTVLITLGAALTLAILGGLLFIKTGVFNVATEWKDPALLQWVFESTMDHSVKRRAASIEVPPLDDPEQIKEGFRSYREMCAICHTPPGGSASPTAKGLNPEPPDLAKDAEDLSDAELFWITKNGIRMTGMPAWGPTHRDPELWNIVAFIKTLPTMTAEEYRTLDHELAPGHSHGDGEDPHNEGGHGDMESDEHHHDEAPHHDELGAGLDGPEH